MGCGASVQAHGFSLGELVERRDGQERWRRGYVTSVRPLKVTFSENNRRDTGYEWDQVRKAFAVGQYVSRRDIGHSWGQGYVTSLYPLKVTYGDDWHAAGYTWDEVYVKAKPFSIGDPVERRFGSWPWRKGFVTSTDPLKVTVDATDPNKTGYRWDNVRHINEANV